MSYHITKEISTDNWKNFLSKNIKANIFQTPEVYQSYKSTKKYEPIFLAVANDKNELLGVLLAVIQKEHSGFLGNFSARSIIWGGPLVKDNNPEVLDLLLKEYKKIIKGKAIYSQFRNLWNWNETEKQIFKKHGFNYEAHLDILIDLSKSEDELLMEMHNGRRKNIRRAERIPLDFAEIVEENEFNKCILLIEDTYKRVKLPCPPKSFFYNTDEKLKPINGLRKFAAKFGNEIISTRFVLCYKGLVYDWFAGTDDRFLDKYPNDFLPWKIMLWAKKSGYDTFDFGGAGKPNVTYGVRDYKMKFGGKLVEFGRFEQVHKPFLMKLGQLGMNIYKKIK